MSCTSRTLCKRHVATAQFARAITGLEGRTNDLSKWCQCPLINEVERAYQHNHKVVPFHPSTHTVGIILWTSYESVVKTIYYWFQSEDLQSPVWLCGIKIAKSISFLIYEILKIHTSNLYVFNVKVCSANSSWSANKVFGGPTEMANSLAKTQN